jgi:hypothetical protein
VRSKGARDDEAFVPHMRIHMPGLSHCAKARYPFLALVSQESKEIYVFDLSVRKLESTIDASIHFDEDNRYGGGGDGAVCGFVSPRTLISLVDCNGPLRDISNSTSTWCFWLESRPSRSSTAKVYLESP